MEKLVLYIHGKGGSPDEAEHYKLLFPKSDVLGLDYHSQTPWEANEEFPVLFHKACRGYHSVILIANSIGAFVWTIPTAILYGAKDNLISYGTVSDFALKHDISLTIMENGEHWFHTEEQMQFLDNWLIELL